MKTKIAKCLTGLVLLSTGTLAWGTTDIGGADIGGIAESYQEGDFAISPVLTFNGTTLQAGTDYDYAVFSGHPMSVTNNYADLASVSLGGSVDGFGDIVDTSNQNEEFGRWAGWFIGYEASCSGITGFTDDTCYGLYANGLDSANAEISRAILNGRTLTEISVDVGVNWDSNDDGSYRGAEFLDAEGNVVFGIRQSGSQTISYYGAVGEPEVWSEDYGTEVFTVTLMRTEDGYAAGGTTRTGRMVGDIKVPTSVDIAVFRAFMNCAINDSDARQFYFDNLRYTAVASAFPETSGYAREPGEYTVVFTGRGNFTGQATRTFAVHEGPRPDLVVEWVEWPAEVHPGKDARFAWKVKNEGGAAAVGDWTERLWLAKTTERLELVATNVAGMLAAGEGSVREMTVTMPAYPTFLGECTAVVAVNADGRIAEASAGRGNNDAATGPVAIDARPREGLMLHAGLLAANETWEAGLVHLVTATLTVPDSIELSIEAGSTVKFMPGTALIVEDGAVCAAEGVVFTHVADDTVGGDTMEDGDASKPVHGGYDIVGVVLDDENTRYKFIDRIAFRIADLSCRQRYARDGLVDIDFTVVCSVPDIDIHFHVSARDTVTGKSLPVRTVVLEEGEDGQALRVKAGELANGRVHLVWDAGADAGEIVSDGVEVEVQAFLGEGIYMVVDLSAGNGDDAEYPVGYLDAEPRNGWGDEFKTSKLVLRRIQPGSFTMGSPPDELGRLSDREYQHEVTISRRFYIGVFEVTQKQWELVTGGAPSSYQGEMRPVECVSYNMIRGGTLGDQWPLSTDVDTTSFMGKLRAKTAGCDAMRFDLPTEAQWEYACRAGTTTAFNCGKNPTGTESCTNLTEIGRYGYNSGWYGTSDGRGGYSCHTTVGTYLPNAWGLYDMHGNVDEWCLDWFTKYLGLTPVTDPTGAPSGTYHVTRGGSWLDYAQHCRSAHRNDYGRSPSFSYDNLGCRLACSSTGVDGKCKGMSASASAELPLELASGEVSFADIWGEWSEEAAMEFAMPESVENWHDLARAAWMARDVFVRRGARTEVPPSEEPVILSLGAVAIPLSMLPDDGTEFPSESEHGVAVWRLHLRESEAPGVRTFEATVGGIPVVIPVSPPSYPGERWTRAVYGDVPAWLDAAGKASWLAARARTRIEWYATLVAEGDWAAYAANRATDAETFLSDEDGTETLELAGFRPGEGENVAHRLSVRSGSGGGAVRLMGTSNLKDAAWTYRGLAIQSVGTGAAGVPATGPMEFWMAVRGDADSDGDGIPDALELQVFGSDPARRDTACGGLTDWERVYRYGLAPAVADTAGDGISDMEKVMTGRNPAQTVPESEAVAAGTSIRYVYDEDDRLTGTWFGRGGGGAVSGLTPAGNPETIIHRDADCRTGEGKSR